MRARALLCAANAAMLAPMAQAAARDTPPEDVRDVASASLFVELVVNGEAKGVIVNLVREGPHLWIDADSLREAGIPIVATGRIDLAQSGDIRAVYDESGQRLLIEVSPELLPTQRIAGGQRERVHTSVSTGALLNYDLFVQHGGGDTEASLWTEQRLFGPPGTFSNTGVVRLGGGGRQGYVRFDTVLRHVDEDRALVVNLGDTVTRALPWSQSVRIGGLQIARSFRVRPDLVTTPLPDFSGQAAVPSGVDLFIDGYRQMHSDVAPGRFVLDNIPVVSGSGEARIVTTDAVGRQIATVIPFYVAPELLRPGLTDWAFEAGMLRRGYGLSNFGYGRAVASVSLRRGITRTLTLEGHAEGARGLASGGVGAVWAPGLWGALYGSAMASRRDGDGGSQLTLGWTYSGHRLSLGAEHVERSSAYADLGSFDLVEWRGGMRGNRVRGSVAIDDIGSIGLAYIESRARDGTRFRLASASLSASLGTRLSAFGSASYDVEAKQLSLQMRLVLPLGGGTASAGMRNEPGRGVRFEADYGRAVPTDGGLGYTASAAVNTRGDRYGQANAVWRGGAVELEAGAATQPGGSSVWGGASGAVALLGGRAFLANQLPDSFAVVATGEPRVPVYYENQIVGRTGADGRLFVPRVVAYAPGRYAIDTLDLPASAIASTVEKRVALREGTGAVIAMPVEAVRSATLSLVDADGKPLPPGTRVTLPDGGETVAGWDGIVLIECLTGAVALSAETAAGKCTARVTVPEDVAPFANLGAVPCR